MRRLFYLLLLICCPLATMAQAGGYTTVTAIVQDAGGNLYVNAPYTVSFYDPGTSGKLPLLNGSTFQTTFTGINTDSSGNLSVTLPDNQVICSSSGECNTQWRFTITSQRINGAVYSFNTLLTIDCADNLPTTCSANTINITSQLKAAAASLPISPNSSVLTPSSINNIQYVDGVHNATVQAAITAACTRSPNGVVIVPPGIYVGPTTFCSGLKIDGLNYGLFNTRTVFQYTSALSIANFVNLDIEGVKFDFQNSANANLTLSSISASRFDFEVSNVPNTVPALVLTCTSTNNLAYDRFYDIITNGGSEGIRLSGLGGVSPTCAVTENNFGFVQVFSPATMPSGNWTGIDLVQDADSNTFERVSGFSLLGLTTVNGIYLNSSSLTTNNDTVSNQFLFVDGTTPSVTSGCAIQVNQSSGNYIRFGVLNWDGPHTVCEGAGATPSLDFAEENGSGNFAYFMNPIVWGATQPQLRFSNSINSGTFGYLQPSSGFSNNTTWTLQNLTGVLGLTTQPVTQRNSLSISDQGTACTNGELALGGGWQSTGTATVTAAFGTGQNCSWTITTGTTTGANPTITDTLTNPLPSSATNCFMLITGGTHTAAAGDSFQYSVHSATAPVFTFNGTPTAGGTTYFVTRQCGP